MDKAKFWAGKHVFLTGHTGFKGSWLSLWLQSMGAKVTGYSLAPPTQPNLFESAGVQLGMTSLFGDVLTLHDLLHAMDESKPAIVIHMAAQSLVRYSYRYPVETFNTNVLGTVNVLEAIRHTPSVRAALIVTSDKCYENREGIIGHREGDPLGGQDPYSSSKACAELVVSAYRRSYFGSATGSHPAAVATARAGNVIGGGDWASDRLIPDTVRAITSGEPVKVRYPGAIRPWQHVLEPLCGYLDLVEKLWVDKEVFPDAWNFGPDEIDAREVAWVADRFTTLWGDGARWVPDGGLHPSEARFLRLDCSKARSVLNWAPRLNLQQALGWTVEWYKNYYADAPMREMTDDQIQRYQKLEQL